GKSVPGTNFPKIGARHPSFGNSCQTPISGGLSAGSASARYGRLVRHCGRGGCRPRLPAGPTERAMREARERLLNPMRAAAWIMAAAALIALARPAAAQGPDEPPLFTSDELEELVAPIALYPDDLVAIVLPASTYPLDVVEAARFLDELEDEPGLAPDEDW